MTPRLTLDSDRTVGGTLTVMEPWMHHLAKVYAACRAVHAEDVALVVVDIDGTLLDAPDIGTVDSDTASSREWVLAAHHPYRGVIDIVRWFDAQPLTAIAVNSARPEHHRREVRRWLDVLGEEYRVTFDDDLVHLRPGVPESDVVAHKRDGLRRWRGQGFRIVTVVESERRVAEAIAGDQETTEALVLPTETILRARRMPSSRGAVTASGHVELVWHRMNDETNLRQFLASPFRWGELDVRLDPEGRLVVRHDDLDRLDDGEAVDAPSPRAVIEALLNAGKRVNLDLKDGTAVAPALDVLADAGIADEDLWINGRVDKLGERGLAAIRRAHPDARIQCPVEFLGPMVAAMPTHARSVVTTMQNWGVDRFSVASTHEHAEMLLSQLDDWGVDVNLSAVTDLPHFIAAVLTLPRSVTADFAMPEWHYFGRGAGNEGGFHRHRRDAAVEPGTDTPR